MQMTEMLDKLQNLEKVLGEKYEIEGRIEELPKSLNVNMEGLERFKSQYIEKNSEYDEQKKKVEELKALLEEATKTRESGEKGMDAVQTHREYEILDKQIAEAKDKEETYRKELTHEEKKLTELNDELAGIKGLIDSTESDVNEQKSSISGEIDKANAKLQELSNQEAEISDGLADEVVYKFQRIIKRNGKGIVAVRGNVCDGCQMILPAQFANQVHEIMFSSDVHNGQDALFCPYCSRVLYYEESLDTEENFFSMEDTGSLLDDEEQDLEERDDADQDGSENDDTSLDSDNGYEN